MLGLGFNSTSAISGGGAGAFTPSNLSPHLQLDLWDASSWFNAYSNTNHNTWRMQASNTADAQAIGQVVDKSQIGDMTFTEYLATLTPVLDTGFDSATGWTLGANWTIGSGVLTGSGAGGASEATYDIGAADGEWYYYEIDTLNYVGGNLGVSIGDGVGGTIGIMANNSTYKGLLKADVTTNGNFRIETSTSDYQGDLDNLKVYGPIPGNHVSAGASSQRPAAGTDGSGVRYLGFAADLLSTTGDDITLTDQLNTYAMHQPSAGSQGTYACLVAQSMRTATVNSFNAMGDNLASVWDASLWMSDPLTEEWNRNSTSSVLEAMEWYMDDITDNDWAIYVNGAASALASGSLTNTYAVGGSVGRVVVGADGNRNVSFDYIGNIYQVVCYAGERSADLHGWVNGKTGSQL